MMRPVSIEAVLNGFIVKIGCSMLVTDSVDKLTAELNRYFKNPNEVEKEYVEKSN